MFDAAVLGMGPHEAAVFWIRQKVRGQARPPMKLPTAKHTITMVRKFKGAIAYIQQQKCIPDGIRIISIIKNKTIHGFEKNNIPKCT